MKTIKVKFVDFWENFDPRNNFIANIISQKYQIELSDTPDYLIFSVFGYDNIDYHNCTKYSIPVRILHQILISVTTLSALTSCHSVTDIYVCLFTQPMVYNN